MVTLKPTAKEQESRQNPSDGITLVTKLPRFTLYRLYSIFRAAALESSATLVRRSWSMRGRHSITSSVYHTVITVRYGTVACRSGPRYSNGPVRYGTVVTVSLRFVTNWLYSGILSKPIAYKSEASMRRLHSQPQLC